MPKASPGKVRRLIQCFLRRSSISAEELQQAKLDLDTLPRLPIFKVQLRSLNDKTNLFILFHRTSTTAPSTPTPPKSCPRRTAAPATASPSPSTASWASCPRSLRRMRILRLRSQFISVPRCILLWVSLLGFSLLSRWGVGVHEVVLGKAWNGSRNGFCERASVSVRYERTLMMGRGRGARVVHRCASERSDWITTSIR